MIRNETFIGWSKWVIQVVNSQRIYKMGRDVIDDFLTCFINRLTRQPIHKKFPSTREEPDTTQLLPPLSIGIYKILMVTCIFGFEILLSCVTHFLMVSTAAGKLQSRSGNERRKMFIGASIKTAIGTLYKLHKNGRW